MTRQGKTSKGSHEYNLRAGQTLSKATLAVAPDHYTACQMGNSEWVIFRNDDGVKVDVGVAFNTLKKCREWYLQNIAGIF